MALWFCTDCTAAYSVGAPRCPHCKSTNYTEEEPVAKNSVHMGPSNAVTGEGMPEPVETATAEEADQVAGTVEAVEEKPVEEKPKLTSRGTSRRKDNVE